MNEPPASNINIRTSTRLLEREPKKAPVASIETVPFGGSLFPSPTTGSSQCSDSSHRPRTPSWELLLHSFTIGSRSYRSPGQAPTLELEPLWACRSSPPKVDGHRNVLCCLNVPTKLAPSGSSIIAHILSALPCQTNPLPSVRHSLYSRSLRSRPPYQDLQKVGILHGSPTPRRIAKARLLTRWIVISQAQPLRVQLLIHKLLFYAIACQVSMIFAPIRVISCPQVQSL